MPPILAFEQVSKRFGAVVIANGIDLALADGYPAARLVVYRQETDRRHGEIALHQYLDELLPDKTDGAENGDVITSHGPSKAEQNIQAVDQPAALDHFPDGHDDARHIAFPADGIVPDAERLAGRA